MAANRLSTASSIMSRTMLPLIGGVGDRMPSNDLAVVSIDDEGQAYQVTVPAGDLESV